MLLTHRQVVDVCRAAGFRGDGLIMAACIALAESEGYTDGPNATHVNDDIWHSVDRGLFQINDHYHVEVTNACAYNAACAARAAYIISDGGTNWGQWSTFHNLRYRKFVPEVTAIVNNGGGTDSGGGDTGDADDRGWTFKIYNRPDFEGDSYETNHDEHYVTVGNWFGRQHNNFIRSGRVPSGHAVTLYENINYNSLGNGQFKGDSKVFTADIHDTFEECPWVKKYLDAGQFPHVVSSFRLIAVSSSPGGGGIGPGESPIVYDDGFKGLAERIAMRERISTTPEADTVIPFSLGDFTIPGIGPVHIGTDITIPGSGIVKMMYHSLGGLIFRVVIVILGIWLVLLGARNT